ncbi:MAG: Peptidase signal peptidase [candidate division NC10 bacterium]|jgi:signal peptidase I|nr:Peptidase signal peptidase [candidate division NC10 bacterium]
MTGQVTGPPVQERQEPPIPERKVREKSVIRQYTEAFLIAILLALVIRTFVVQAFKIPSGSMLPTLQIGDHLLVNKFLYWFTDPQRGDVIVFKFPQDEGRDFIKRVIALPGDKVEVRGKRVYVNDKPVQESYAVHLDPSMQENPHSPRDNFAPVQAPSGQLFMMGDNRDYSMDSRFWGFLDIKKIKGKAFIIYWSWDRERFRPRWERIGKVIR